MGGMGAVFQGNFCQGTPANLCHTSGSAVSPHLPGSVARHTVDKVTTCQAKVRDLFQRVAISLYCQTALFIWQVVLEVNSLNLTRRA